MMRQVTLPAALAALASALLFLSATSGVGGLPFVVYFVQLPLFYIGFSAGLTQAALASGGALILVLVLGGGLVGFLFALVEALPCLVTVRQALLYRRVGARPEDIEWYPLGDLLALLTGLALVLTIIGLMVLGWQDDSLASLFAQMLEAAATQLPVGGDLAVVLERLMRIAPLIPGIIAASWLVMTVVNGFLGHTLAQRSGGARRPVSKLTMIELPAWCAPAFLVAGVVALLVGGDVAFFARSALVVLGMPLLFLGLATVHVAVRKLPSPKLALVVFYIAFMLLSWPLGLALVVLGLLEEQVQLRRRLT